MNRRLFLTILACVCTLAACGDKDKPNLEDLSCDADDFESWCKTATSYTVCEDDKIVVKNCDSGLTCNAGKCLDKSAAAENMVCNPDDFKGWCKDATTYTVCEDNVVTNKTCSSEEVCNYGACKLKPVEKESCTPGSYQSLCKDGSSNFRSLCSEDGKVEFEACPAGTTCTDGVCKGAGAATSECGDVGCSCDISFRNSCDNGKRIACDNGKITEFDCTTHGLICLDGACVINGYSSCEKTFASKCIGNSLLSCRELSQYGPFGERLGGMLSLDISKCDFYMDRGVCATINNITDCFRPCNTEGEVIYTGCDSDVAEELVSHGATKLTCTKSVLGLYYVPTDAECGWCGNMIPGHGFEYEWNAHICASEKVSNSEEPRCEGNKAITSRDGYKIEYDCGEHKCVVDGSGEEKEAKCMDECSAADVDKYKYSCYIDPHHYADSLRGDAVALGYVCKQIGDNYYWQNIVGMDCEHGCDPDTGECRKIHPDEYKLCSTNSTDTDYYAAKCDQGKFLNCESFDNYNDNDDNDNDDNDNDDNDNDDDDNDDDDDRGYVTAEDCGTQTCVIDAESEIEGCVTLCKPEEVDNPGRVCINSDFSVKKSCLSVGPESDKKYVLTIDYSDRMYCSHGCDQETGDCIKLHQDEFTPCEDRGSARCEGDILLECQFIEDRIGRPQPIGDAPTNDASLVWVANNCAGEGLTCIETADEASCMPKCTEYDFNHPDTYCYYSAAYGRRCEKSGDKYYWKNVNESCAHGCDSNTNDCARLHKDEGKPCTSSNKPKCVDGNVILYCNSSSVYQAVKCDGISKCVNKELDEWSYEYNLTNAMCDNSCQESDPKQSVCEKNEYGEFRRYDYVCNSEQWIKSYDKLCEHGCNDAKTDCKKVHQKEYTECEQSTDVSYCDDSYHFECVDNEWNVQKCKDSCNEAMGCYKPCNTPDEDSYRCEEENGRVFSQHYVCQQSSELSSLFDEPRGRAYCDKSGCRESSGKCEAGVIEVDYEYGEP